MILQFKRMHDPTADSISFASFTRIQIYPPKTLLVGIAGRIAAQMLELILHRAAEAAQFRVATCPFTHTLIYSSQITCASTHQHAMQCKYAKYWPVNASMLHARTARGPANSIIAV